MNSKEFAEWISKEVKQNIKAIVRVEASYQGTEMVQVKETLVLEIKN